MIVARTIAEAAAWSSALRAAGARVALVPTLGALHEAHAALAAFARGHADAVALSVFVNPTQFGPDEDFDRYPRDLEADLRVAEQAGADLVFAPGVPEMYPGYPADRGAWVDPGPSGDVFEGAVRPGFFRGVATVVTKLLAVFEPASVCCGQKDGQQVVVLRQVLRDLCLPVTLHCMATVRAADGLAHSSRNVYLSAGERKAAPALYAALARVRERLEAGERDAAVLAARLRAEVEGDPRWTADYAAVVSARDLAPLERARGHLLVLVAARLGAVRLIDNLCLEVDGAAVRVAVP